MRQIVVGFYSLDIFFISYAGLAKSWLPLQKNILRFVPPVYSDNTLPEPACHEAGLKKHPPGDEWQTLPQGAATHYFFVKHNPSRERNSWPAYGPQSQIYPDA
ncbi:hypothetical protein [Acetobacter musti]|uniref:hypothetical protein n=1 Tax=Acetobacter musti TaxID=864732 RepID=UPI001F54A3A2|nr:hypothetical protein [Acetobacter musti]